MRAGWFALVLAACGSPSAPPRTAQSPSNVSVPQTVEVMRPFDQLLPMTPAAPLGARVVGIAFAGDDHNRSFDEEGAFPWDDPARYQNDEVAGAYRFWVGTSLPYPLYVPASSPSGIDFAEGAVFDAADGTTVTFDAARPAPGQGGLAARAHLVEVEVNGGRGGKGGAFVATNIRVTDGTGDTPLRPAAVLAKLRTRFDATVLDRAKQLETTLVTTREKHDRIASSLGNPPEERTVAVWPTWSPADKQLHVTFVLAAYLTSTIEVRRKLTREERFLFARAIRRVKQSYGAAMAVTYVVDARGELLRETVYTPIGFSRGTGDEDDWEIDARFHGLD